MGYQEDTIDWQAVRDINTWLDEGVGQLYQQQPFAQDWARVAKIAEELGEAVENMPADATAQDYERVAALDHARPGRLRADLVRRPEPWKPPRQRGLPEMLDELADTAPLSSRSHHRGHAGDARPHPGQARPDRAAHARVDWASGGSQCLTRTGDYRRGTRTWRCTRLSRYRTASPYGLV